MSGFQGAKPEDLDDLAGVFGKVDRISDQALRRLDGTARSERQISGPAGDRFRNSLLGVHHRLSCCAEQVRLMTADLREQAEQQRRASAGGATPPSVTTVAQPAGGKPAERPLLFCYEGNCLVPHGRSEPDKKVEAALPPAVRAFEEQVIKSLYGDSSGIKDLATMRATPGYHAYANVSVIGRDGDMDRLWNEYLRAPAPSLFGPHSRPVKSGDWTWLVMALEPIMPGNPVPTPLFGGFVEHLVDQDNRILANITLRAHTVYPGYIIRWIEPVPTPDGQVYRSWTLGRGTGYFGDANEVTGPRLFHELDQRIRRRAGQ
jgi:hypothetical protein